MRVTEAIGGFFLVVGVTVAAPCFAAGPATGSAPLPHTVEPGRETPQPSIPPKGDFEFSFPEPSRTPIPRDVDGLRFAVKELIVDGAAHLSDQDIAAMTAVAIGQEVTLADVIAVAEAIEAKYRERGFLLVRAFVPPQKTRNGVFHISVVEGYIKNIEIEGLSGSLKSRVEDMLAPIAEERPLRRATIERVLLLANDLPGLKAVGLVRPSSDEPGAADLVVRAEKSAGGVTGSIDNHASRYAGPWTFSADAAVNSLFGEGEQLAFGATATPNFVGQNSLRLRYLQPVGSDGLTMVTSVDRGAGLPGYSLRPDDIKTRSLILAEHASYPLIRSRASTLALDAGVSWKTADTSGKGTIQNIDRWWAGDIKLSWTETEWLDGITAASLGVSRGLPGLGSVNPNLRRPDDFSPKQPGDLLSHGGDPQFTKVTFDLKRSQIIDGPFSAYAQASGQYSFNRELSGEEFAVGGLQFGRGFDPAQLSGDHGLGESAELRYDTQSQDLSDANLQFYGFFDHGNIWNKNNPFLTQTAASASQKSVLSSTGGGIRFGWGTGINATLELAHPLTGPRPTVHNDPIRPYLTVGFQY